MTARSFLTDEQISAALTPGRDVRAPLDLAGSIAEAVGRTPQRRGGIAWLGWPGRSRPTLRLLLMVVLLGLALVAGIALAGALLRPTPPRLPTDAAMFRGGPSRSGVVAGPGPATGATIAWQQARGGAITANMPAVAGGVVYVADASGRVGAYRADTGDPIWDVSVGSPANTSPAVGGGFAIVGDAAGDIVALDIGDGRVRWIVHTGGEVRSSAAIVDGVVYVGSGDGELYALDLATGHERWRFAAGGPVTRAVAVDDGTVFVGGGSNLSAVAAAGGALLWQRTLDTGNVATPAAANGVVLAASGLDDGGAHHALYAIDARTGAERWVFDPPSANQWLLVAALGDGLAYAAGQDGFLYAINLGTGTLAWRTDLHATLGTGGALADGVIYLGGGDHAVYALDSRTGAVRWRLAVPGEPGTVAVVGTRLYVATSLGAVVAIGPAPPDSSGGP